MLFTLHNVDYRRYIIRWKPQIVVFRQASTTIFRLIFELPATRSMKVIGTSAIASPCECAMRTISI